MTKQLSNSSNIQELSPQASMPYNNKLHSAQCGSKWVRSSSSDLLLLSIMCYVNFGAKALQLLSQLASIPLIMNRNECKDIM